MPVREWIVAAGLALLSVVPVLPLLGWREPMSEAEGSAAGMLLSATLAALSLLGALASASPTEEAWLEDGPPAAAQDRRQVVLVRHAWLGILGKRRVVLRADDVHAVELERGRGVYPSVRILLHHGATGRAVPLTDAFFYYGFGGRGRAEEDAARALADELEVPLVEDHPPSAPP